MRGRGMQGTGALVVGAGPRLRLHIPNGAISLDGVFDVTQWTSEYRVGSTAACWPRRRPGQGLARLLT